jgi:hypothetical protein
MVFLVCVCIGLINFPASEQNQAQLLFSMDMKLIYELTHKKLLNNVIKFVLSLNNVSKNYLLERYYSNDIISL